MSIYSTLARRLRLSSPGRLGAARDAAVVGALVGGPPGVLVLVWVLLRGEDFPQLPSYLIPATLVAVPWLVLGPSLVVFTERLISETLDVLRSTEDDGWDLDRVQESVSRARRSYPMFVAFTTVVAGCAVYFGRNAIVDAYALSSGLGVVLGVLVVLALSVTAGSGLWGMWLTIVILVRGTASNVAWHPFEPAQVPGVEALSGLGYFAGVALSVSSLQIPVLLRISSLLNGAARIAVYTALATIFVAGLAMFLLSTYLIGAMNRRQVDARLGPLADPLDQGLARLAGHERLSALEIARLDLLLSFRQALRAETAAPHLTLSISRATSTVLIPIAAAVVPLLASGAG